MYVVPAKQIYHCFVCGAGGDAFKWMMHYHKMTFPQALEHLAEKAGIVLQKSSFGPAREPGQPTERERILDANAKAVSFFRALLRHPQHGQIARDYVAKRGINEQMQDAFAIGYAPDRWDGLALMIQEKRWDAKAFELAGLISNRDRDGDGGRQGHYDRLRHRLIFPIFDALGRPIAFGGRKLREEDNPKYLNSPETPLFHKSSTLYGLHLAKKAIMHTRTAVIVEGYTDVVACHQYGVGNVVATLGTALTPDHANTLRHFCQKVVLIFDGDDAGQKAADRALEVFMTGSLDVAIAVLPDDLDPADLLTREGGIERWNQAVDNATDSLAFQFQRVRQQFDAAQTITARQQIVETYLQKLANLGLRRMGVIRRAIVLQRLAQLVKMDEQTLSAMLQRLAPAPSVQAERTATQPVQSGTSAPIAQTDTQNPDRTVASGPIGHRMSALQLAEKELIGCLLRQPGLFHHSLSDGRTLDEALTPSELASEPGRRLYQMLYDRLAQNQPVTIAQLLGDLAAEGQDDLASLATGAESHVEQACGDDSERLAVLFVSAVNALVGYHRQQEYERQRAAVTGAPHDDAVLEQMLRRVQQHHKEHPSAIRIARVKRDA
jgi:DNA primase